MLLDQMLKVQTQHIVALYIHTNELIKEIDRVNSSTGRESYKKARQACADLCAALENVIRLHHIDFIASN